MTDLGDRRERIRQLFEQHADELYRYVRFIAPLDVDPRDIVQEVFIRAFQGLHRLRQPEMARAWLYRIARNLVYDELRRRRTVERHAMWLVPELGAELGSCLEVWDAMRALTPLQQQVLYLHAVEGLQPAEIGYALGKPAVTVRVTLLRARRALAEQLGLDAAEGASQARVSERGDGV